MNELPRVAIRVDASAAIGTGHLKRCLSLAQALTEAGAEVRFVCRELDTVAAQVLGTETSTTHWLPAPAEAFAPEPDAPPHGAWAGVPQMQDAADTAQTLANWRPDTVVVDHYAFDALWHRAVRAALGCCAQDLRLLVIDDTADRVLDADALLDHNWA
ncbi:MAG: UDP-2,4-diacetamido-2,4,6-trideoxy-beta-L-altropyranose hydrolase, partial [Hydrogenophaga sp.]